MKAASYRHPADRAIRTGEVPPTHHLHQMVWAQVVGKRRALGRGSWIEVGQQGLPLAADRPAQARRHLDHSPGSPIMMGLAKICRS